MKINKNELKQRVITGVILISLILSTLFFFPTWGLGLILIPFLLLGGKEWAYLANIEKSALQWIYGFSLLIPCGLFAVYSLIAHIILIFVSIIWLLLVFLYFFIDIRKIFNKFLILYFGFLLLPTTWFVLITLHDYQAIGLLFLFILVWVADSIAYFAGSLYGKTPLSALSPNKTQEGLFSALIASIPISILGAWSLKIPLNDWVFFIIMAIITVFFALVGDLFESLLKRLKGVKNSGSLLPGHGGVMDRIDSLTAAAPIFLLGFWWII